MFDNDVDQLFVIWAIDSFLDIVDFSTISTQIMSYPLSQFVTSQK